MTERRRSRLPRGLPGGVPGGLPGWLLGVALIAALSHLAVVHAYPRLLMHGAWEAISRSADHTGLVHAPRPDASSRTVVRPSPDLVYSVCLYDLAAGPWSIRLEVPDGYMSVSLYAMNTDNFFTVNDRQAAAIEAARRTLACGPAAFRAEMAPSDRARRTGDWPGDGEDNE